MDFLDRILQIQEKYAGDSRVLDNQAVMYGVHPKPPLLAEHIIFPPMPRDVSKQLVGNYKRHFPEELLEIYSRMNGVSLFWTPLHLSKANISIPYSCFSIYGVPLTSPHQHIEPYNISIEDLNRPAGTPDSWLKFGSFSSISDLKTRIDLFVDTDLKKVFAVKHQEVLEVIKSWDSIDGCLCDIFDTLTERAAGD